MIKSLDPILNPIEKDLLWEDTKLVDSIYKIIKDKIKPPIAMSIDGYWGSGKTTLMKLLFDRLCGKTIDIVDPGMDCIDFPVFWFNAWEKQQTPNIIASFLQELALSYEKLIRNQNERPLKIIKTLLMSGMSSAVKYYTKNLLSLDSIVNYITNIENENNKEYEKYRNSIRIIKSEFRELVTLITQDKNKPLIIFIDDLDRCLPYDAISILESIKNIFVTPNCNCIFICGIDTHVAKKFISNYYNKIEDNFSINYFRKIFNITIPMPYIRNVKSILTNYFERDLKWKNDDANFVSNQITATGEQASIVSIRKYLNIANSLYIFLSINEHFNFKDYSKFIIILFVIKEVWYSLYEKIIDSATKQIGYSFNGIISELYNYEHLNVQQKKFLDLYFIKNLDPYEGTDIDFRKHFLLKYPSLL